MIPYPGREGNKQKGEATNTEYPRRVSSHSAAFAGEKPGVSLRTEFTKTRECFG